MRKLFSFIFIFTFSSAYLWSQTTDRYFELTMQAVKSYGDKEYKKSAQYYSQAFQANSWKGYQKDRYDAACAWAKAKVKDSAFFQLFKVATLFKYQNYTGLTSDSALISLHTDARWKQLCEQVKKNIISEQDNVNSALVKLLDSIYTVHQSYRFQAVIVKNTYGHESDEVKDVWKAIRQKDSATLSIVEHIIDTYGWLGKKVVGENGNSTLSLVLLHADLATQEKYLPLMREAFKKSNVDPYDMASMEDLVALREGKQQIYGTNLISFDEKKYYISPMIEPENVNERRAKLG
ncbi:MAG: DUF6624 domain-containing protein, partial [Bacteroidia bacterium]